MDLRKPSLEEYILQLPQPFNTDRFACLRKETYDRKDLDVYTNEDADYAFVYPPADVDYDHYRPREQKLDLGAYKRTLNVLQRRYEKIVSFLPARGAVLEMGASDAGFLRFLRERHPDLRYTSVETDQTTKPTRAADWLEDFASLDEVVATGRRFEAVGLFHVLEHIRQPHELLRLLRGVVAPGGVLIIEVPSLEDPLLSLYRLDAYQKFYFQSQHPFVYSSRSLKRLLVAARWEVPHLLFHQRYGLENHLTWMLEGRPGGTKTLGEVFGAADPAYRRSLEQSQHADAVIAIATCASI